MRFIKYAFLTLCAFVILVSLLPEPKKTDAVAATEKPAKKTVTVKPASVTEIVLTKPKPKPKERVFDRSGSAAICQILLKKRVKYPATLRVHGDRRYARNEKIYQVGFSFTSRNGFNVPVTQKVYCNFDRKTHLFASIFIQ